MLSKSLFLSAFFKIFSLWFLVIWVWYVYYIFWSLSFVKSELFQMYGFWCPWWILDNSQTLLLQIFSSVVLFPLLLVSWHICTHFIIVSQVLKIFFFVFSFLLLSAFHTFKLTYLFFPLTFSNILMGSSKAFFISFTVSY